MTGSSVQKVGAAAWFVIEGDLRYLSHRDTLRLWQRAAVRGGAPAAWSEGYNPHLRLSLPLPRSVGMAGEAELLWLELSAVCTGEELSGRLGRGLGALAGVKVLGASVWSGVAEARPRRARYRITLGPEAEVGAVRERLERFRGAARWPVRRAQRGRHPARELDVRAGVEELRLEGESLEATVRIEAEGTVRMDELLGALGLKEAGQVVEVRRLEADYGEALKPPGR